MFRAWNRERRIAAWYAADCPPRLTFWEAWRTPLEHEFAMFLVALGLLVAWRLFA